MSRHRDIRNMDYSEDYDGFDDVYGHSVDDDYYISPSNRQFIYNRDISQRSSEGDIKEEDESEAELSDIERVKLESCIVEIKNTLESINISRNDLVNIIIKENFDIERSINTILKESRFEPKSTEKDYNQQSKTNVINMGLNLMTQSSENKKQFTIPNIFNKMPESNISTNFVTPEVKSTKSKFVIPNLMTNVDKPKLGVSNLSTDKKPKFLIPVLSTNNKPILDVSNNEMHQFSIPNLSTDLQRNDTFINTKLIDGSSCSNKKNEHFNNLSELVSSHLKNNSVSMPMVDINSQMNKMSLNSTDLLKLTPQFAKMSMSESKLLPSTLINPPNQLKIDLSVALKSTISTPLVLTNKKEESIDFEFIHCDEDSFIQKQEPLVCTLDVTHVKNIHSKIEKQYSFFGKVVCRRYKKYVKSFLKENVDDCVQRFDFSSLSPDDKVRRYLKKKMNSGI